MTDYNPSDDPGRDPADEPVVEPDDDLVDNRTGLVEDAPDAERVLREAGGDADRAEDIIEARRLADLRDIPADERPAV